MPLYPYRCTQCGHRFEKIQNFSAEPERECPQCHGVLERLLTAPRLNFKGAGWYVNDYAGKGSAPASESAPAETKTASSSESASSASSAPASTPAPAASPAAASGSSTSSSTT